MARTIRDAQLETRTARDRLATRRKEYWRTLVPKALHLGYKRRRSGAPGVWVVRRYIGLDGAGQGRYKAETLGLADDYQDADGARVLSYGQAQRLAHGRAEQAQRPPTTILTVGDAI